MNWHPLTLAIWLTELTAWALYLAAAWRILTTVARWDPSRSDAEQLRRERSLELATFQGCWVMALQAIVLVLVIAGISNVWVPMVSGAMCGTGVLQAMGSAGRQALALQAAALFIFYGWHVAAHLSRNPSDGIPALVPSRILLLIGPVMAVATMRWVQAVAAVSPHAPVSCCAVLYDQLRDAGQSNAMGGSLFHQNTWLLLASGATLVLAAWGLVMHRRSALPCKAFGLILPLFIAAWAYAVYQALIFGVAPYIFQILHHPCPWCLFLVDHGVVGLLLFGLPVCVIAESAAGLTAWRVARCHPQSSAPALCRLHCAGLRISVASIALLVFAAWPMVSWRMRFGGWMH